MTRNPVWSNQPPRLLKYHSTDIFFSMVIIAGYAIIHNYCQYLFLGPCNTLGSNFPLGLFLMIGGGVGLSVYRIRLLRKSRFRVKILVFTEGAIIREIRGGDGKMIGGTALGDAPGKLRNWSGQGAQIEYLTSRRTPDEIQAVRRALKENRFPRGPLNYRLQGEEYKDVAEKIMPDIIVEDDCAGIGGKPEMAYPHIRPDLKQWIMSVVVREFEGIDQLPDGVLSLLNGEYSSRPAR